MTIMLKPTIPDPQQQLVIVGKAAQLVNQVHELEYKSRRAPSNKTIRRKIAAISKELEIIGETAAFFGGYRAMLELNHAIIEAGGHSLTANEAWWGICGWAP